MLFTHTHFISPCFSRSFTLFSSFAFHSYLVAAPVLCSFTKSVHFDESRTMNKTVVNLNEADTLQLSFYCILSTGYA